MDHSENYSFTNLDFLNKRVDLWRRMLIKRFRFSFNARQRSREQTMPAVPFVAGVAVGSVCRSRSV